MKVPGAMTMGSKVGRLGAVVEALVFGRLSADDTFGRASVFSVAGSAGGTLVVRSGLEVSFRLSWANEDDAHGMSGAGSGSGLDSRSTKFSSEAGADFCCFGSASGFDTALSGFDNVPYLSTGFSPKHRATGIEWPTRIVRSILVELTCSSMSSS